MKIRYKIIVFLSLAFVGSNSIFGQSKKNNYCSLLEYILKDTSLRGNMLFDSSTSGQFYIIDSNLLFTSCEVPKENIFSKNVSLITTKLAINRENKRMILTIQKIERSSEFYTLFILYNARNLWGQFTFKKKGDKFIFVKRRLSFL